MATAELLPTRVGVSAEQEDEVFEIFDEAGNLVGREARGVVHTQGLLHRAVYCFLFDTAGRLLIQRRSDAKKVGPGQWDLSCAEHLQPGESFRDAAARGLEEELGVRGVELTVGG